MMVTFRELLDRNKGVGPGFHLMRHALAAGIVLFHCRTAVYWSASAKTLSKAKGAAHGVHASGFNLEDIVRPGLPALVGMFFALSGFLVAGSAVRTARVPVFFANRALRIVPALSVEVTLSALILGPLVTTLALSDYFTDPQFFRYFGNIGGFITFYLPGVFEDLPWPRIVNGNLWTLPPEFYCYAFMMAVMYLRLLQNRALFLATALLALAIVTAAYYYDPNTYGVRGDNFYAPKYIVFLFFVGVTAFLYADRIPVSFPLFSVCAVAYWLSIFTNTLTPLSGIPLVYMMMYLGMTPFPWWDRIVKSDYSYGIYLYGFPIMQTLVHFGLPYFGHLPLSTQAMLLFPPTIALTVVFAALSWKYIERPALGLRKTFLTTDHAK